MQGVVEGCFAHHIRPKFTVIRNALQNSHSLKEPYEWLIHQQYLPTNHNLVKAYLW